ncbi:MAG: hypothetical protein HDQ88_06075 [Clostridia bacterium]|nr:hypothetical protein [Clostridia bacterium]
MGILYLFLTFLLCFILVVTVKLIILGLRSLRKQPEPVEEKKPTPQKEPVYYIVEKKRARKANYSEPKEIEFKK